MRARLNSQEGFGLIELLIAMVILNVALLAILAMFSSGAVGVARAAKTGTAAVLADQQMELYRTMPYDPIGLDTASAPGTGAYVSDTACVTGGGTTCTNTAPTAGYSCTATAGATSVPYLYSTNGTTNFNPCIPSRIVNAAASPPSPDGKSYIVDTYVRLIAATASVRATKQVTVVVRDNSGSRTNGITLARETSTFDCATGQIPVNAVC